MASAFQTKIINLPRTIRTAPVRVLRSIVNLTLSVPAHPLDTERLPFALDQFKGAWYAQD
jgi:hypothetical protein